MLDFAKYLKEQFNEDVSSSEKILKTKWDKVVAIVKEAFDDRYADKKTALQKIQTDFVNKNIAPKSIDIDFLKENIDYVVEKVNSLTEGEIKIIINNDVQKSGGSGSCGREIPLDIEMESAGKKRGRPKKVVKEEEDVNTEDDTIENITDNDIDSEEKTIKVSVDGNKVIIEPSENTGLESSEHEFETEEEVNSFTNTLKDLFVGFNVEMPETSEEPSDENNNDEEDNEEAEEEVSTTIAAKIPVTGMRTNGMTENEEDSIEEPSEENGEESNEKEEDMDKIIKVSVDGNKVIVEPSENTGLESSEHEFETEEEVKSFTDSLKDLFVGFNVEMAGEEGEDSDEISWDDVSDEDGEEAEEEIPRTGLSDSIDPKKLIGNLVKINEGWCNVTSINENNEFIGKDIKGNEHKFSLDDIELAEMAASHETHSSEEEVEEPETDETDEHECDETPEEEEATEHSTEEEIGDVGLKGKLTPEQMMELKNWVSNGGNEELSDELYQTLLDLYADEMPYGAQKARTEDPLDWLFNKVSSEFGSEEEVEEPSEDASEEEIGAMPGAGNESLSFANYANRYMELDEELYDPKTQKKVTGLTSKPSAPPKKIEKIPAAPKSVTKKGPSANLTAKPKAPPKKIDNVKSAPKAATKIAPTGSFTKSPQKPSGKIDNVKAPQIPQEYKKGGSKS